MGVRIKWLDRHGGAVVNERWTDISEGKALDMIRRAFKQGALDTQLYNLRVGKVVITDAWHIKRGVNT